VPSPSAILILAGIAEPLAEACARALLAGGLRVLRVAHVAAAAERIPVVMPQVVVVSSTLLPGEAETLADRCVAVGAQVITVAPERVLDPTLGPSLEAAARQALARAVRRGA
jgi:hypothetical protein